jgi:hypothetical protein
LEPTWQGEKELKKRVVMVILNYKLLEKKEFIIDERFRCESSRSERAGEGTERIFREEVRGSNPIGCAHALSQTPDGRGFKGREGDRRGEA